MRKYYRNDIIKLAKPLELVKEFVVYFLLQDEEIVYVGQSGGLGQRIQMHLSDKIFNRFFYFCVTTREEAIILEKEYIEDFCPKYNIVNNHLLEAHKQDRKDEKRKEELGLKLSKLRWEKVGQLMLYAKAVNLPKGVFCKRKVDNQMCYVFNFVEGAYYAKALNKEYYMLNNVVYKPNDKAYGTIKDIIV